MTERTDSPAHGAEPGWGADGDDSLWAGQDEPVWVRNPWVLWRDVVDGVVLLPPGAPEPVVLDLPGALLWQQLDTPGTVRQLAERLAAVCQETPSRVAAELPATLADLRRRRAVRCLDGG